MRKASGKPRIRSSPSTIRKSAMHRRRASACRLPSPPSSVAASRPVASSFTAASSSDTVSLRAILSSGSSFSRVSCRPSSRPTAVGTPFSGSGSGSCVTVVSRTSSCRSLSDARTRPSAPFVTSSREVRSATRSVDVARLCRVSLDCLLRVVSAASTSDATCAGAGDTRTSP